MPSNEIEELYVTLKFREELGDAVEDIDDRVDDLERSFERGMGSAQDETEETTADVEDLQDEVDKLRRKLKRLDRQDANPDVDVDRDRSRGGRGGGLPGPLDEVGEVASFLARMPPQMKAFVGTLTVATSALGVAGGLAGVATALSAKLGDRGLRGEMTSLQNKVRGVGVEFVQEFEPVIRQTVIPALESLASWAEQNADGMADFSAAILGTEEGPATRSYSEAMTGISGLPGRNPDPTQRDHLRPNLTQQTGLVTKDFASESEIRGFNNLINREVVQEARNQIDLIRAKMEKMPGFTREQGLQQIIDIKKEMWGAVRAKATAQDIPLHTVDLKSGEGVLRLQAVLEDIKRLMHEVDQIGVGRKAQSFAERGRQLAAENTPRPFQTQAPEGAAPGTGIEEQVRNVELSGERMKAIQKGWGQISKTQEKSNRKLARGIRLSSNLGATLIEAAQGTETEWNRVLGQVLGTVGSIVGIANPVAGAGIAGAGTLLGSFDQGGFTGMGGTGQVAGVVHRGEYVMPSDVVSNLGVGAMRQIHRMGANGSLPGFATGGFVGGLSRGASQSFGGAVAELRRLRRDVKDQTRRLEQVERSVELKTDRRTKRRIVEDGQQEIEENRASARP